MTFSLFILVSFTFSTESQHLWNLVFIEFFGECLKICIFDEVDDIWHILSNIIITKQHQSIQILCVAVLLYVGTCSTVNACVHELSQDSRKQCDYNGIKKHFTFCIIFWWILKDVLKSNQDINGLVVSKREHFCPAASPLLCLPQFSSIFFFCCLHWFRMDSQAELLTFKAILI